MRSLGKFIERKIGSRFGCWTEERDDHPEHELELDSEARPDSLCGGNIASRDGLKILRLSPRNAANHIRWRTNAKRILLVIDHVLLNDRQVVQRQASSHSLGHHLHRRIDIPDLALQDLAEDGCDLLRRKQLGTRGAIRLSGVPFWPRG